MEPARGRAKRISAAPLRPVDDGHGASRLLEHGTAKVHPKSAGTIGT